MAGASGIAVEASEPEITAWRPSAASSHSLPSGSRALQGNAPKVLHVPFKRMPRKAMCRLWCRCDCHPKLARPCKLETTNHYAEANIETKRKAPEQVDPKLRPSKPPRWKRDIDLLTWLDSL
jgi:hypothetical protein